MGNQNNNYLATDGETGAPETISTAYMPEGGQIQYLSEVGFIPRGEPGRTLNLTDYNLSSPTTFVGADDITTTDLAMETPSTFDGGDRSLLDYVYVGNPDPVAKTTQDLASYKQFGAINPNTTNSNVLKLLLSGISPLVGPDSSNTITTTTIDSIIANFPGRVKSSNADSYFKVSDFHDVGGDNYHNRNPQRYEFAFSKKNNSTVTGLSDAEREALVIQSMNLVSPKYSYFTILAAVEISGGSTTSVYALVRRDNESGSYKVLRKSTQ